jgi:hypothetical protein
MIGLAAATLVLVSAFATPVGAETRGSWCGDALVCNESEHPVINPDHAARLRLPPWRGPSEIDTPREEWRLDGTRSESPDGRVCWPHGDHFHCR